MKRCLLLPVLACAALAQDAAPAFEVASVKVTVPETASADGGRIRFGGGCRRPDPGMVNCTNATLKQLMMQAYEVKNYQVEGPSWLESEHFDLMAKIPEGVPAEKVPAMLQALLKERFKVVFHKESRILPAYELSIAKGGPKLKEVDPAEVAAFNAAQQAGRGGPAAPPPPPPPPGGAARPMPLGAIMIQMNSNGARTYRGKMTMPQLVNMIANQLSRPVVDKTDLKGTYDIELTYMGDENDPMMAQMRSMVPPSGGTTPPPGGDHAGLDANAPIATMAQAIQQTLGLKLDAKKAPLDILIIESANKVPTEN